MMRGTFPSEVDGRVSTGNVVLQLRIADTQWTMLDIRRFLKHLGVQTYDIDVRGSSRQEGHSTISAFITFETLQDALTFQSQVGSSTGPPQHFETLILTDGPLGFNAQNPVAAPSEQPDQIMQADAVVGTVSTSSAAPLASERSLRCILERVGVPQSDQHGPDWPDIVTTVMIKNIACRFTQHDVEQALCKLGLQETYSSIRVPMVGRCNRGYAFVEFREHNHAKLCYTLLHGQILGESESVKTCEIVPATFQGLLRV